MNKQPKKQEDNLIVVAVLATFKLGPTAQPITRRSRFGLVRLMTEEDELKVKSLSVLRHIRSAKSCKTRLTALRI